MKTINAYVRKEKIDQILTALVEGGTVQVMVLPGHIAGRGMDHENAPVRTEYGRKMQAMVKIECFCRDREENDVVNTIRRLAATGRPGDGFITVSNQNRLVRIDSGAESGDAL